MFELTVGELLPVPAGGTPFFEMFVAPSLLRVSVALSCAAAPFAFPPPAVTFGDPAPGFASFVAFIVFALDLAPPCSEPGVLPFS